MLFHGVFLLKTSVFFEKIPGEALCQTSPHRLQPFRNIPKSIWRLTFATFATRSVITAKRGFGIATKFLATKKKNSSKFRCSSAFCVI